jgi:hypothetical protein
MSDYKQYSLQEIKCEVLRTLLYFDLFSYPLSTREIHLFLQIPTQNTKQIDAAIRALVSDRTVFQFNEVYSIQSKVAELHKEREENTQRSHQYWEKTKFYGKIIASFPFVKAVFISGSLSKNQMSEQGDIDYFLICTKNRLWIARLALMLFKKVFLRNKHTYFCINYLIDESCFEISPQNIFTATELKTLVPIYSTQHFETLMQSNTWTNTYLPNYKQSKSMHEVQPFTPVLKYLFEKALSIMGKQLNLFIFEKWKRYNEKKYPGQIFHLTPHLASHHIVNRQDSIPVILEKRINEILQ